MKINENGREVELHYITRVNDEILTEFGYSIISEDEVYKHPDGHYIIFSTKWNSNLPKTSAYRDMYYVKNSWVETILKEESKNKHEQNK